MSGDTQVKCEFTCQPPTANLACCIVACVRIAEGVCLSFPCTFSLLTQLQLHCLPHGFHLTVCLPCTSAHASAPCLCACSECSKQPSAVVLAEAGERPVWRRWLLSAVNLWDLDVTAEQSSLLRHAVPASKAIAVPPQSNQPTTGAAVSSGAGRNRGAAGPPSPVYF